jgi:hypothetical protein
MSKDKDIYLKSQSLPAMKTFFQSILRISLGILLLSCETEKEPVGPEKEPSGQSAGAVTPIGVPDGAITTAQIAPAGEGKAFRFLPHGVNFTKPAIVTFRYSQSDLEGTAPALMRIGYQNTPLLQA